MNNINLDIIPLIAFLVFMFINIFTRDSPRPSGPGRSNTRYWWL